MSISRWLVLATLVGGVVAGPACTQKTADDPTIGSDITLDTPNAGTDKALDAASEGAAVIVDETKAAGDKTADATTSIAQKTGDKTREIAGQTADKTREIAAAVGSGTEEVVSTTGEAITDGWITTKVRAKLIDETLLKESDVKVGTDNHVVTLKGTAGSAAAKARAAAIARGTEGVMHVVNELVVSAR